VARFGPSLDRQNWVTKPPSDGCRISLAGKHRACRQTQVQVAIIYAPSDLSLNTRRVSHKLTLEIHCLLGVWFSHVHVGHHFYKY